MTAPLLHAENAIGDGRTLCGLADEAGEDHATTGETENPRYANLQERVTCGDCLRIIAHVHNLYTPAGRVR